jgi:hypothetical protein
LVEVEVPQQVQVVMVSQVREPLKVQEPMAVVLVEQEGHLIVAVVLVLFLVVVAVEQGKTLVPPSRLRVQEPMVRYIYSGMTLLLVVLLEGEIMGRL